MGYEKYEVVILPQAEEDIDEILGYIVNGLCNPTAAKNLWNDVKKGLSRVAQFPYAMPDLKCESEAFKNKYKRLDVNNFVLIYKIAEEQKQVRIMAAFYAPSDVLGKLADRL